jgi:hypothetical protein
MTYLCFFIYALEAVRHIVELTEAVLYRAARCTKRSPVCIATAGENIHIRLAQVLRI